LNRKLKVKEQEVNEIKKENIKITEDLEGVKVLYTKLKATTDKE
jgi:hypothetical protein